VNRHALPRRLAGAAAAVALVAGASVLVAPPASAHNVLLRTAPASGATVAAVPGRVTLVFDLPCKSLGTAVVVDGPGGNVADGAPALVNTSVVEAVRSGAPAGSYTVRWRVTSADGHPVSGSFAFTATAPGGAAAGSVAPSPASTSSGGSSAALVGIGVGALALVALATVLGVRRRARASP
jgi:copper resistance protein C